MTRSLRAALTRRRGVMKKNGSSRRPAASTIADVEVSHPRDDRMPLASRYLFADPRSETRRLAELGVDHYVASTSSAW